MVLIYSAGPNPHPPLAGTATTCGCWDDGRLGIFLADASGHGLGPALVVSQIRTLVRTLCDGSSKLCSPHDVLARVSRRLSDDLDDGQFVTVFLGFLDSEGNLDWQSAGHGPILFRPSADEPIQQLYAPIPPIISSDALDDDQPDPLKLKPGAMLAVMSDGIFESFDADNQLFGITRVIESLEETKDKPTSAAVEKLLSVVVGWQTHDQPKDDQTIILINRK